MRATLCDIDKFDTATTYKTIGQVIVDAADITGCFDLAQCEDIDVAPVIDVVMPDTCDNCHKPLTGRKFRFTVIGRIFQYCSNQCRANAVRGL